MPVHATVNGVQEVVHHCPLQHLDHRGNVVCIHDDFCKSSREVFCDYDWSKCVDYPAHCPLVQHGIELRLEAW